jgi:hypothetical protein
MRFSQTQAEDHDQIRRSEQPLTAPSNNAGKSRGKQFQRGNNAGKGRPCGSRNKATLAIDKLLDGQAEAITQKCVALALEGDTTALRLAMERIAPVRKGRPVVMSLPAVDKPTDVTAAISAVVASMAAGNLTPEEASAVAGVIEVQRRAIETADHEARLTAIEDRLKEQTK